MFHLIFRGRLDPTNANSEPDFSVEHRIGPLRRVFAAQTVITGDFEEGPQATWCEIATGVAGWVPDDDEDSVWFGVEVVVADDEAKAVS